VFASKDVPIVAVTAVVDEEKEQGTVLPLRRQGEASAKSVVRLIVKLLEAIAVDVSILMASWLLDETLELEGVTEMMRFPLPITKNKAINIIILFIKLLF
jgi:hypothetical protein